MKITTNEKQKIVKLFSLLGINESLLEINETDDSLSLSVNLPEDEVGIYIGRSGQTLDSLQLIVSLMLNNGQEEHRPVLLDFGGYRTRRLETIKEMVDRISQAVLESGVARACPPLSATERRQVHLLLADHKELSTHSEGDHHNRRLFISKKQA